MVLAQIGNSSNVGVFVLRLGLFVGIVVFFHNVVDEWLVLFAIGIDHWSSVTAARIAITLHVALLFAVTADNVGIAGAFAASRGGIGSRARWGCVEVAERLLLSMNGGDLVDFFIGKLIPEDGVGLVWRQGCFNSCNLLRSLAVVVDALKLSSKLHAFH